MDKKPQFLIDADSRRKWREKSLLSALFLTLGCTVLGLVLGACSGTGSPFAQDPLAGRGDAVRKALPPGAPAKKNPPPEPEGVLKIDTNDSYTFQEDMPGEITISGRVLKKIKGKDPVPGKDFQFSISNMNDFPGAIFDQATNKFQWKPPVQASGDHYREMHLDIVLLVTSTKPMEARTKSVKLFITHKEIDPEIREVSPSSFDIVSGEQVRFTVRVYDPDTAASASLKPYLTAVDAQRGNSQNIAGYVHIDGGFWQQNPERDPANPAIWIYHMILDTSGADLKGNLAFSLETVSTFGHKANKNVEVHVKPIIREPVTTLPDFMQVKSGEESTITFTVFDPLDHGSVTATITSCSSFPVKDGECGCVQGRDASIMNCTLHWVVPTIYSSQDMSIVVEASNAGTDFSDTRTQNKSFSSTVSIQPLPPPTPTPTPIPTPVPTPRPTPKPLAT